MNDILKASAKWNRIFLQELCLCFHSKPLADRSEETLYHICHFLSVSPVVQFKDILCGFREGWYHSSAALNGAKGSQCAPQSWSWGMQVPGALTAKEEYFLECFATLALYHNYYASLPTRVHPFTLEGYPDLEGTGQSSYSGHFQSAFGDQSSEEQCKCSWLEMNTQCCSPSVPKQIKRSAMCLVFEKYSFWWKPKYFMNQSMRKNNEWGDLWTWKMTTCRCYYFCRCNTDALEKKSS